MKVVLSMRILIAERYIIIYCIYALQYAHVQIAQKIKKEIANEKT